MFKILLAEDEENLRKIIKIGLSKAGYTVVDAYDGKDAISKFEIEHFDLVVTDIMMPRLDGNGLIQEIRKINRMIPIIMLTALGELDDKEKSFDTGADDYLVKPIAIRELVMRIKVLLRRYESIHKDKIEFGDVVMDYKSNIIHIQKRKIELTKKEFLLLFKLLSRPEVVFTRSQIIDEIWGFDNESYDRTVDTHIKRIREKVVSNSFSIITIRGIGYKAVVYEKN